MVRDRLLERAVTPFVLSLVVVALVLGVLSVASSSLERLVLNALVSMIAVIGIYLFTGLTGTFSFGQLGFMAIGAYTTAVLTVPPATKRVLFTEMPGWLVELQMPFVAAVLVGGVLATVVAVVLSVPMARMPQLSAGLATLAVLITVYVVAGQWTAVTNGTRGISSVPTGTTPTILLGAVVVVIVLTWLFQTSSLGLRIRATREDEIAARAVGIRVGRERGIAFVTSALVMGVAGGLYAQLQGNLSPDAFYLTATFLLIAMLVVGGFTTLTGAVLGTIVLIVVRRVLEYAEAGVAIGPVALPEVRGLTEIGTGLALLVVLALRPLGITGGRELSWAAVRRALRRVGSGTESADLDEGMTDGTPVAVGRDDRPQVDRSLPGMD